MKKMKAFTAILLALALCLGTAAAWADEDDFTEVAGVWYEEEIMMNVTEDGRFVLGWNDGDWTGSLEPDWRTDEDGEEYVAYQMLLDDPEQSIWELELIPDPHYPGRLIYCQDGTEVDWFYNIPVCVMDLEGEDPDNYEPYALIDETEGEEDEDEPAITLMFTFLRPVKDIAVMTLSDQEIDEDGNLGYSGDTLEWWPELDSRSRIVVKHVFQGDLPDLSVDFIAEDGNRYAYAVEISGEDGTLILWEIPAGEG